MANSTDTTFLAILMIIGFVILGMFILFVNEYNYRQNRLIAEVLAQKLAINIAALLGKADESTDASAVNLQATGRLSQDVSKIATTTDKTHEMIENSMHNKS